MTEKIHKVPKTQGKKAAFASYIAEELSVLIKLSLISSPGLSRHQPTRPLTPAGMIAQNIWTTLGHHTPILHFFLLISCVNICTADPAGESPVPCKRLQFPCASLRGVSSGRFVESGRLFEPKSFCRIFLKGLKAVEKHREANSALGYTKRGVNQLKAVREAGFIPGKAEAELSPLHFAIFCTSSSGLCKMRCIFLIVA